MAGEIDLAFAAYIAGRASVSAIVGTAVFAEQAPQGQQRPFLVYRLMTGERTYHSQGSSGLVIATIEITCAGRTYLQSRALYEAIRNELDGFQGTWSGTSVRRASVSPPVSGFETPVEAAAGGLNALKASLDVIYREPLPVPG